MRRALLCVPRGSGELLEVQFRICRNDCKGVLVRTGGGSSVLNTCSTGMPIFRATLIAVRSSGSTSYSSIA